MERTQPASTLNNIAGRGIALTQQQSQMWREFVSILVNKYTFSSPTHYLQVCSPHRSMEKNKN